VVLVAAKVVLVVAAVAQEVCELVRGIKLPKELRTLLPLVVVVLGLLMVLVILEAFQVGILTQ
jgi:hypothetical protein